MKACTLRDLSSTGRFVCLLALRSTIAFLGLVLLGGLMTAAGQSISNIGAVRIEKPIAADDTRYRIGPGDVLGIVVRKAPELSLEAVRVDQRGMIRIPMIDDEIMAACLTEHELETHIADLYRVYKNFPSVNVFVREFQSRPVSVIGAVNSAGQFRLQRQVRVLELISLAAGPSPAAGRIIDIIHTGGPDVCKDPTLSDEAAASIDNLIVLQLNDTLKGREGANPFVRAGDIISLPEADQVFVYGHVNAPRAIALKDKPITLSRAVALAGGPSRDAQTSKIRIIRQGSDGGKIEMVVDLGSIEKRRAPDVTLLANDIIDVPTSVGKTVLHALTGAVAPTLTQLPIRAIP